MSEDKTLTLTPSDIAGAIHRAAFELAQYVGGSAALAVDVHQSRAHLARMFELFDALEGMQEAARAAQQQNNGAEARAN